MKFSLIKYYLYAVYWALMFCTYKPALAQSENKPTIHAGVTIECSVNVTSGTNKDVILTYKIKNENINPIRLQYLRGGGGFEEYRPQNTEILKIDIFSPSGKQVYTYYELPSSKNEEKVVVFAGRTSIAELIINHGEELTRYINLSKHFHMTEVGQYRYYLTRFVYVLSGLTARDDGFRSDQNLEMPVKFELPCSTFKIDRIDPLYESSLANMVSLNKELVANSVITADSSRQPTNENKHKKSGHFLGYVSYILRSWKTYLVLVVLAIALAYFGIKRFAN